jgi:hypothetical protein
MKKIIVTLCLPLILFGLSACDQDLNLSDEGIQSSQEDKR